MKCAEVKEHLETFLDNEIDGNLSNGIARHLDICEDCRDEFSRLHSVSSFLKTELPASPAKLLDSKVLAAFEAHHQKKSTWNWIGVFSGFWALKPALAILTVCFLTGTAFLIGRATAPNTEVMMANQPQIVEKEVPTEVIKYVEVPTTKYVQIPLEKEKIVTRTVYQKVEVRQKMLSPKLNAETPSFKNYETAQQIDLKDFQPLSEITPKVLKKGEANEK